MSSVIRKNRQIQVYIMVDSRLTLANRIIRIWLKQNGKEDKLVLQYNTNNKEHDSTNFDNFTQLSKTLTIQLPFQIRRSLSTQILNAKTKEIIGKTEPTSIGSIYSFKAQGIKRQIIWEKKSKEKQDNLQICLKCEQTGQQNHTIDVKMKISKVQSQNLCLFCSPDQYYLKLYKNHKTNQFLIYQSQFLDSQVPNCQFIKLSHRKFSSNRAQQQIVAKLFNRKSKSLIGQMQIPFNQLQNKQMISLQHGTHKKGEIQFFEYKQTVHHQFYDFIDAGMEIALTIAIDFTASNGNYTKQYSLHYCKDTKSYYQIALEESVKIILDYDTDKLVPVYGFGAKVNMDNYKSLSSVDHCFPINGNVQNPNLLELEGILQAYRNCLPCLTLFSPTHFSQILQHQIKECRLKKLSNEYKILMILTDGIIKDFERTKQLIIESGDLPMSIIIIGISKDQKMRWDDMITIDNNDESMTDCYNRKSKRDNVKFVQFMKYKDDPTELARVMLEELPRHVQKYHKQHNLQPNFYKKDDISKMQRRLQIEKNRNKISKGSKKDQHCHQNSYQKMNYSQQTINYDDIGLDLPEQSNIVRRQLKIK